MGLWGKIKKAVKKAADAVEDFVNDVGDAAGDAVEAVGDAINDGLNWIGEKIGGKAIFSWLGGIIKGVFSIVGAVIKGVFGIVGGILGGIIKVVGGIFTGQGGLILEGLWDMFSPVFGTIIVVLGKLVALVQSIIPIQGFERPLTEKEKSELKRIFKTSLNYYVIRIIEGRAGLFGINSRPFTLGNTIYMKTKTFPVDLLAHETTHVWQYQQNGNRYTSDALAAQWFIPDAYNWEREINVRNKSNWTEFNAEAQAAFIQDLWKFGKLRDAIGNIMETGNGAFFDADDTKTFSFFEVNGLEYTDIANEAVKTVRKEWF
jgi:hypothetical protein